MLPKCLSEIWTVIGPAAVSHLWQSTLFAGVAGLLVLALRKSHARARYWLWLAASLKFLVPFSLLIAMGSYLAIPRAAVQLAPRTGVYAAIGELARTSAFEVRGLFAAPIQTAADLNNAGPRYSFIHLLPAILIAVWLCGFVLVLFLWLVRWRRISRICADAIPLGEGREVEALRRLERAAGMRKPLAIRLSRASLEPGVFGIFQPVLVWPDGISGRLDDAHLRAILAHELWHVRRRDNLAAALHMLVEAIFWFHPLVWWLGARMVDERERACDEAAIAVGNEPRVYAESVLKACEFCVASPVACVAGVTGSDLKKRIVRIMTERPALRLDARRKLLLAFAAFIAIAVPIGFGLANGNAQKANPSRDPSQTEGNNIARDPNSLLTLQSQSGSQTEGANTAAPKFEVVSIKPDHSAAIKFSLGTTPGRFSATAVARMLIEFAYNLKSDDQIVGAPSWVNSEKFDINAKEEDAFAQKMRTMPFDQAGAQVRLMVRSMLADRFKLKVTQETKDLPVYALVVAKNGPKLTLSKLPPPGPIGANPPGPRAPRGVMMRRGAIHAIAVSTAFLTDVLSRQPELGGRVVVDETGLKGIYDFTLNWMPEFGRGPMGRGPGESPGAGPGPAEAGNGSANAGTDAAPDSSGPSIFTAVQQQLGLRLKPTKGPVPVLVIDHIEQPTPD
ncbi:MAG: TIGR03435 family protein [Terriglobia bacterium]